MKGSKLVAAAGVAAVVMAPARMAFAHATYNISGYGSGLAGSTNGADGSPTAVPPAVWSNGGVAEYSGSLPVHWYAGMHSRTTVRTIQTGLAPNPPSGSLLTQVNSYNAANEPDLPTDRVIAVGGKSWSDPDNNNQGWGHGLDYGIVHFSPIGDLLADGPLQFTITLNDDPSDGVATRLAFAIYGGWDTGASSVRHQTFVTSPTPPASNPLGSTGLTLLDTAVATSAGQTLSRTYTLDATYAGEYTIFVGALGGVAGQYQLTLTTAPNGSVTQCQTDLAAATAALDQCEDDLAAANLDADGDGVNDAADTCPSTLGETSVDASGCSLDQFCSAFDVSTKTSVRACKKGDWRNDEPLMTKKTADCLYDKVEIVCQPAPPQPE